MDVNQAKGHLFEHMVIGLFLQILKSDTKKSINRVLSKKMDVERKRVFEINKAKIEVCWSYWEGTDSKLASKVEAKENKKKYFEYIIQAVKKPMTESETKFLKEEIEEMLNVSLLKATFMVKNMRQKVNYNSEEGNNIIEEKDRKEFYYKNEIEDIYFKLDILEPFQSSNREKKEDLLFTGSHEELDKYKEKGRWANTDLIIRTKSKANIKIICWEMTYDNIPKDQINSPGNRIIGSMNPTYRKRTIENFSQQQGNEEFMKGSWQEGYDDILILDKEELKRAQSISYIESYLKYIEAQQNIKADLKCEVSANVISNRDEMFYRHEFESIEKALEVLEAPAKLYRSIKTKEIESKKQKSESKIKRKIERYLSGIYTEGIDRIDNFINNTESTLDLSYEISDFTSTNMASRVEHTKEVLKSINRGDKIINLLGSPGIGKTTSISAALGQKDNFVFCYASSRKTVNKDLLEKVRRDPIEIFNKPEVREVYKLGKIDEKKYANTSVGVTVNYETIKRKEIIIECNDSLYLEDLNNSKGKYPFQFVEEMGDIEEKTSVFLKPTKKTQSIHLNKPSNGAVLDTFSTAISKIINEGTKNKITGAMSLQGYQGDIESLKKTLARIIESMTGQDGKIDTLWFAFDELTGASGTVKYINALVSILLTLNENNEIINKDSIELAGNTENVKIPKDLDIRIFIADASISNEEVFSKYLQSRIYVPPTIYNKTLTNKERIIIEAKKGVTNEVPTISTVVGGIELKNTNSSIININSYPAKKLKINHIFYNTRFIPGIEKLYERIGEQDILEEILIDKARNFILNPLNEKKSILFYIQDKKYIKKIKDLLMTDLGLNQVDIQVVDTNSLNSNKEALSEKNLNKAKIYLITSAASRGISFKKVTETVVLIPNFNVEEALNEIIQVVFRGRGDEKLDNGEKTLTFISGTSFQTDIMARLKTVEQSFFINSIIHTRIKGIYKCNGSNYQVVPNGEVGIKERSNNGITEAEDNIKEVEKNSSALGPEIKGMLTYLKENISVSFRKSTRENKYVPIGKYKEKEGKSFNNINTSMQTKNPVDLIKGSLSAINLGKKQGFSTLSDKDDFYSLIYYLNKSNIVGPLLVSKDSFLFDHSKEEGSYSSELEKVMNNEIYKANSNKILKGSLDYLSKYYKDLFISSSGKKISDIDKPIETTICYSLVELCGTEKAGDDSYDHLMANSKYYSSGDMIGSKLNLEGSDTLYCLYPDGFIDQRIHRGTNITNSSKFIYFNIIRTKT
jgi:hypothetical protein